MTTPSWDVHDCHPIRDVHGCHPNRDVAAATPTVITLAIFK